MTMERILSRRTLVVGGAVILGAVLSQVLPARAADEKPAKPQPKVRIDNSRMRVLVATEQPHKPSALHEHKMNRVMIYLGDGEMTYKWNGKAEKVTFKKGDVRWDPSIGEHIAENTGDQPFQMVIVELLDKPQSPPPVLSKKDPLKLDPKHYKLELDNEQARVLRVRFGPNEKSVEHEHTYSNVVVSVNEEARGTTVETRLDAPGTHTEENPLDSPVERFLIDVK